MKNVCVMCGKEIPEGAMVCEQCVNEHSEKVLECKHCGAKFKIEFSTVNFTRYCPVCANKLDGRHVQPQYSTRSSL